MTQGNRATGQSGRARIYDDLSVFVHFVDYELPRRQRAAELRRQRQRQRWAIELLVLAAAVAVGYGMGAG